MLSVVDSFDELRFTLEGAPPGWFVGTKTGELFGAFGADDVGKSFNFSLIAVDASTGDRTLLSDDSDEDNSGVMVGAGPLAPDVRSGVVIGGEALVISNGGGSLYGFNLTSGERRLAHSLYAGEGAHSRHEGPFNSASRRLS